MQRYFITTIQPLNNGNIAEYVELHAENITSAKKYAEKYRDMKGKWTRDGQEYILKQDAQHVTFLNLLGKATDDIEGYIPGTYDRVWKEVA